MNDHMVRLVSEDGSLRAAAALTTDLVDAICRRQGTDLTATVALGRLVTGAALLGSQIKGDQRLVITVEGNGPLQKMHAETDASGHIRGTVKVPVSGLPLREGRFDVAGAVGKAGFLHVVKDLGLREPYRGTVQLPSSEIAEDLAWYLTTSEQVPSTVALGVYVEPDGRVSTAGGFLIQALPGGRESFVKVLEERVKALPSVTSLLRQGLAPVHILERIFDGIPLRQQEPTSLSFRCSCSREQILRMLSALGGEDLRKMAAEERETTVTCEFCREAYAFTPQEIAALAKE